jgi:hypothetical protein
MPCHRIHYMGWIPLSLAASATKDIGATLTLHIQKYYTFNRVRNQLPQ